MEIHPLYPGSKEPAYPGDTWRTPYRSRSEAVFSLLFAGIHIQKPSILLLPGMKERYYLAFFWSEDYVPKYLTPVKEFREDLFTQYLQSFVLIPESGYMRISMVDIPMFQETSWHHGVSHHGIEPVALFYDNIENIPVGYLSSAQYLVTSDLVKAINAGMNLFSGNKGIIISGKGFSSTMNLYGAIFSETPVIFPLDPDHNLIKNEVKKYRADLMHPRNLKIFRGETLFVIPVNVALETANFKGYIIYSLRKEEEIRERFGQDIELILENLNGRPMYKWVNPAEAVADIAGTYEPFLHWKVQNNRILVDVKRRTLGST